MNGKRVAVTGGAGFIGSHLVDRLVLEHPAALIVIDNLFLGRESNLETARRSYPDLKFFREDATDLERMRQILLDEKIEIVFDLATIPLPASLVKPRWSSEVIVDLALVLGELCREDVFQTLIHCSTSEAFGSALYLPMDEKHPLNPHTPYAAAKAAADLLLQSYSQTFKIDLATVRPFNAFGPRQNDRDYSGIVPRIIQRVLSGQPPVIFGDGMQTRDYTFAPDIADGIVAVAQSEATRGRVINIASGREISIKDLVASICTAMGYLGEPVFEPARVADVRRHLADVNIAKELLGFETRTDFTAGIQITVNWYLEKYRQEKSFEAVK
jgi:UDP-glucose 4-epimerase